MCGKRIFHVSVALSTILFSVYFSVYQMHFLQFDKGVKGEAQAVEGEERYFLLTKGCSTNLTMIIIVKSMIMMWKMVL